jgi:hypothetical protein
MKLFTSDDPDLAELSGYPAHIADLWLAGEGRYSAQGDGVTELAVRVTPALRAAYPALATSPGTLRIRRDPDGRFWQA